MRNAYYIAHDFNKAFLVRSRYILAFGHFLTFIFWSILSFTSDNFQISICFSLIFRVLVSWQTIQAHMEWYVYIKNIFKSCDIPYMHFHTSFIDHKINCIESLTVFRFSPFYSPMMWPENLLNWKKTSEMNGWRENKWNTNIRKFKCWSEYQHCSVELILMKGCLTQANIVS